MDSKLFRLPTSPNYYGPLESAPPVDVREIAANQQAPAPDSRFPGWAAPMSDGRLVTNYDPHCASNIPAGKQFPTKAWMQKNSDSIIELSRKAIAKVLNCNAQEIIFTSGGTESNNIILRSCVKDLQVNRIITSKIEHHAVLHTIEALQKEFGIQVDYVAIKKDGSIDINNLKT
jgi:DNA-binding transcriptional MocR family regulator